MALFLIYIQWSWTLVANLFGVWFTVSASLQCACILYYKYITHLQTVAYTSTLLQRSVKLFSFLFIVVLSSYIPRYIGKENKFNRLIMNGANINATNVLGYSALINAIVNCNKHILCSYFLYKINSETLWHFDCPPFDMLQTDQKWRFG